jgi:hypothetical protein
MTTIFRTGGHCAYVYLSVRDDEGVWSITDVCYVNIVDLDADADRNGNITFADEDGEDTWAKGTSAKGAIVLPNCDKDNTTTGAPDNWIGGDWDIDGYYNQEPESPNYEGPNQKVDNDADIADLAELWFHQMLFRVGRITLEVTKVNAQHSFYNSLQDKDIVRIFLPNQQQNGNWVVGPDAEAIIGPEKGATVEFTSANGLLSMFQGDGIVKFCVEGIELGAMVDITLKFYEDGVEKASDTVRMRVAPFVLADHTMTIDTSVESKTVYVADSVYSWDNIDLREKLGAKYPDHLDATCSGQEPWQEEGYEVGYVKAPYGSMPVFLVSPRAYREGSYNVIAKFVHNTRLDPNVGVWWGLEHKGDPEAPELKFNSTGNIDSRPHYAEPGDFFFGVGMGDSLKDFFNAQDINPPLGVNTNWLYVGHVDEVISFASDGQHTIIVDPEVYWALLVWADSIDWYEAKVLVCTYPESPYHRWVYRILTNYYNDNLSEYNFNIVMAPYALPSIRTDLNLPSPETVTRRYSGNGELTKGGAFVGFFPNSNKRKYRITFSNSTDYSLEYKELPSGNWISESNPYSISITCDIDINQDCIFKDAGCFILKHWWGGTFQQGDYFEFEADPSCSTIEMPVLFFELNWGQIIGATAYTINHVNCLVDGQTVFTGQTHEQNTDNVIGDYVSALFQKAGYNTIIEADSQNYHRVGGDIHCATNAQRIIPDYNWWECE